MDGTFNVLENGAEKMKIKKLVKLYSVEFIEYTDVTHTAVINDEWKYLNVDGPDRKLVIREDEFDFYKQFGEGFRSLNYVGSMYVDCWLDKED